MTGVLHLRGDTLHGRKGAVENRFRYSVDYVLLDPASDGPFPALFSRNRRNLVSLHDSDHGGAPKAGRGTRGSKGRKPAWRLPPRTPRG